MKVGIDVTAMHGIGGVPTSIRLLLDALERHAPGIDVVALAPEPLPVPSGIEMRATGGPKRSRWWRRSRALRRAARGLDVFHSPVTAHPTHARWDIPTTATVHELPFTVNHRLEGILRALAQGAWLDRALKNCRVLVAPSHVTLRQMEVAHPAIGRMTMVVPHPAPPAPVEEQKEPDGSILFVGRLVKRKCVDALLAGARALDGQIRLVGPYDSAGRWRVEEAARRHGVADRLLLLGTVDDETLDYLYRQASVVGLLSASEGFGFPVLEALQRGVPVVVTADTGAAETGGDAVLTAHPRDPASVAAALSRAVKPDWRKTVRRLGPARALWFSPERTARGYVRAFQRALEKAP